MVPWYDRPPDDASLSQIDALSHPQPIAATAWWRRLAEAADGLPDRRRFDLPAEIKQWLPFVMLVDPEGHGRFRIRIYGTMMAETAGIDLTGWLIGEIPAPFDSTSGMALLVRTIETGQPVFGAGHYGWTGGRGNVGHETCYLPIRKDAERLQVLGVRGFLGASRT